MKHRRIDWNIPLEKHFKHFRYPCNFPGYLRIGNQEDFDKYCAVVDKSIEDNIDYTIELYGTDPRKMKDYDWPDIIID